MLSKAYLSIENLERDIESINIYGNSSNFKELQKNEALISSKLQANNFSSIFGEIETWNVSYVI